MPMAPSRPFDVAWPSALLRIVADPITRNGTKVERLNGTSIPQLNPSRGRTSAKRCRIAHPRMICKGRRDRLSIVIPEAAQRLSGIHFS